MSAAARMHPSHTDPRRIGFIVNPMFFNDVGKLARYWGGVNDSVDARPSGTSLVASAPQSWRLEQASTRV